jgi:Fatty acid cis/trans isomerase (CTI)
MQDGTHKTLPHWVILAQRCLVLLAAVAGTQCASDGEPASTRSSQAPAAQAAAAPAPRDPPPAARPTSTLAATRSPDYWRDVKPVLDARCVSCHACFDAPCQLNLASYEGLARGASKQMVYMSSRLRDAEPTRLFTDAQSPAQWRRKGFFGVLDPAPASPTTTSAAAATPAASLMRALLDMKREPVPQEHTPLGDDYDIGTERKQSCPAPDELSAFAKRHPRWGMPYGLPGLSEPEFKVLASWLDAGAPYREPPPLAAEYAERIAAWEAFLNGALPKQKLMSRYLYEHLFLASLYFDDLDVRQYFRIVRSRKPPGQPVEVIATRMPFNDPGPGPFWYRIEPVHATVVAKLHMPYALGPARLKRFQQLFLDAPYKVGALPSYASKVASNPFVAFRDMPVDSRYRFMLDDAEYFIRGFMKGPVCRGQVAVDVIDDRFWVVFKAPDNDPGMRSSMFLSSVADKLHLPAEGLKGPLGLLSWQGYKDSQMAFLMAKQKYLESTAANARLDLQWIWDGDGHNTNAALTILRHDDNASVVRGLIGRPPKTAWVIDYSLFERIHYLLVAGFDVFGSAGHQLTTRLTMDFLRMEGEFTFLALLPKAERVKVRDHWYRDAHASVRDYVYGSHIAFNRETDIPFTTDNPRVELMQLLRRKLDPVLEKRFELGSAPDNGDRADLQRLAVQRGLSVALLPEVSFLAVVERAGALVDPRAVYTLVHDTAHTNVASLFREGKRLVPAEDELLVAPGFIAAYPNAMFRVVRAELAAFVDAVARLRSEADYRALVARFGVERTSPQFWPHSDALAQAFMQLEPLDAGVLDFGRLENR